MSETSLKLVTVVGVFLAVDLWGQPTPAATITLRRAAELALAHAPALTAAQATASERAASARLAADELRPQAWLVTTPGYSRGLPTAIAGSVPAIAGFSLTETLYDRAARVQTLEREADSSSAAAGSERARIEAVRAALLAYSSCWADDRMLAAVQRRRGAAERILDQTLSRQAEGRSTDLEVEQARLNLARARMHALDLGTAHDLDWLELCRLTGWPTAPIPPALEDPLASLPELPDGDDVQAARAGDPELRAATRSISLLGEAADLETGGLAPVVQAEAQYNRLLRANHFDTFYRRFVADNWSVGVSVVLPIWSGGRRGDAAARAEAVLARAQGEHQARASALEMQVRRAVWGADRSRAGTSLAREATAVAREALRVVLARAAEGRGDAGEVENREIALADADEEEARSDVSWFAARVELLALRGDLPEVVLGSHATPLTDPPTAGEGALRQESR
jgi:outer membrane protein TolC